MSQNYQYDTIEEALRDLKEGKIVLVTDDPDRENEGDLICAAEFATRENINFMATYAKGLICTPMSAELAARLNFPPMVAENTDNHSTAFTVAVDHVDTTTGISAAERSYTIMKCVDDESKPEDFRRPGHVFPLISRKGVFSSEDRSINASLNYITYHDGFTLEDLDETTTVVSGTNHPRISSSATAAWKTDMVA